LLEPEHGLIVQSYAPRRQAHGRMNAGGWGAGFFAAGRPEQARWRSSRPLWADASFASVALDETATAPFARGRWLLSHNGVADRSILGPRPHAEPACDSAQLAAHLFDFGPDRTGEFVRDLGKRDPDAQLNLLLTDGRQIIATRWNDTLSILHTRGGVVVASEPYDDDPGWADVPDHHLVDVADGVVTVTELEA
jgi:gamma-glutamyl hercynylcysteine S-oxide hydrolase